MLLKCIDNESLFNSRLNKAPERIDLFTKRGIKLCTGINRIVELNERLFIETPIQNVYMDNMRRDGTRMTPEGLEVESRDRQIRNIKVVLKELKTSTKVIGMVYIRLNGLYIIE